MQAFKQRSRWFRAIFVLAAVATLAACGGSTAAPILSTVGNSVGGDNLGIAAAPNPIPAASAAPSAASGQSGSGADAASNLQIVYTGSLDLVVADLDPALAKAKAAVAAVGGYIGASKESNDIDRPTATVTYRIPASRWEDAITSLRGLATKVVTEQTEATEVGSQIVDLEARLRNLRASETALLDIAKTAGKISDLLDVQAQLTDIRGQIEELDAQRQHLADQVSYGTLVTSYGLEIVAVKETTKGWDPGKDVDNATAALIGFGQNVASGAIWFGIVWLPLLLVVAVVAFIAFRLFRRFAPKARSYEPITGWGGHPGGPAAGGDA